MTEPEDIGPEKPGRQSFEFTYVLEPRDFGAMYAAQAKALRRGGPRGGNRVSTITFYAVSLGVGGIVAWMLDVGRLQGEWELPFVAGASTVLAGFYLYFVLVSRPRYMRSMLALNGLEGVELVVIVDGKGLTTVMPHSRGTYDWQAVTRVDATPEQFLFWVSDLMAIIVPRRLFATPAEETAFTSAVRDWSGGKANTARL